jgi:hypothetical protein
LDAPMSSLCTRGDASLCLSVEPRPHFKGLGWVDNPFPTVCTEASTLTICLHAVAINEAGIPSEYEGKKLAKHSRVSGKKTLIAMCVQDLPFVTVRCSVTIKSDKVLVRTREKAQIPWPLCCRKKAIMNCTVSTTGPPPDAN